MQIPFDSALRADFFSHTERMVESFDYRVDSPWHAQSSDEVMKSLQVSPDGLSGDEAIGRLEKFGPNRLPEARKAGPLKRFLGQFHNVLIYVLIAAAVVTAWLGHWIDSAVIAAVVIINALIGFIQEGKAEEALASIRNLLSLDAQVLRNGEKERIPAEDLVPGDLVFLTSGDKVPADLRIFENRSLRIEEAALTGESVGVEKDTEPVDREAPLGDRFNLAFSGTVVTYGQAKGVVVATGANTELGKINQMMADAPTLTTPLIRQITRFGHLLTGAIVLLGLVTFLFGYFVRGFPFEEIFLAVVGLAVAAIPEGLPAILTITLAIGVQAMARRKAIIRRLPAVETLGSVSVICSDKTGTLTRGEMTVTHLVTEDQVVEISGIGYRPEGSLTADMENIDPGKQPLLDEIFRAGLLCNDSRLRQKDDLWKVEGDPTEGALLAVAGKAGLSRTETEKGFPRIDSIPFESHHKYMATLHETGDGERIAYLKGAPERILERCQWQLGADGETKRELNEERWKKAMDYLAGKGERLLAVAVKKMPAGTEKITHEEVAGEAVLLGLFGLIDPPREEAVVAVRTCRKAGIRVKMITGDHALTASAIGEQIGLASGSEVVTGEELEKLSDEELIPLVDRVDVFARTSPEHKLRLVRALQANGRVVAMTGDGVNDAPALKTANVGVAMGLKGTEAAKEASEMVLVDDNFASIASAVEEGRQVYDNIKKSILFILPTNGAQSLIIVAAILAGLTLPLTPVQILWVNMITAVTLALALVFEPAEDNLMKRPPRDPSESILPLFFLWRIGFVSVLIMVGALAVFLWKLNQELPVEQARTAALNTLIFGQIFYLLNSRFMRASAFRRDLLTGNLYVFYAIALIIGAQIIFTYVPFMQTLFGTAPMSLVAWVPVLLIGLGVFLAVELEKAILRARAGQSPDGTQREKKTTP